MYKHFVSFFFFATVTATPTTAATIDKNNLLDGVSDLLDAAGDLNDSVGGKGTTLSKDFDVGFRRLTNVFYPLTCETESIRIN